MERNCIKDGLTFKSALRYLERRVSLESSPATSEAPSYLKLGERVRIMISRSPDQRNKKFVEAVNNRGLLASLSFNSYQCVGRHT